MSSSFRHAIPIFPCSNLDQTLTFYARLGFGTVMRSERYAVIRRDGAELHFSSQLPATPAGGESMCCIPVASTEALHRELTARGLVLEPPVERDWYILELSVRDPDGNTLRFAEPIEDPVLQFEARR